MPRITKLRGPTAIDVVATVASANEVRSPLSQLCAAILRIELVERLPPDETGDRFLGAMILGDIVRFRLVDEDVEMAVVIRRAQLGFHHSGFTLAWPLAGTLPPELVPALRASSGLGVVCWREHSIAHGDRVRIRATVEPTTVVTAAGYRSCPGITLTARDDLGPVQIDEIVETPRW